MITTILIAVGLILLPLLPLLGFVGTPTQSIFGMGVATALCLWGYFTQEQRPLRNKWLLFFCGYLLISAWQAPYPNLIVLKRPILNFWIWKSMFYAFMFLGMYRTISSAKLTEKNKDLIFDIVIYTTMIMSVYCIGQRFGLLQWFTRGDGILPVALDVNGFLRAAGTLGSPNYVSPYLMLGIPFALYRKKWLFAIPIVLGVIATNSQMAMGSGVLMLAVLACFIFKKYSRAIIISIIGVACILSVGKIVHEPHIDKLVNDSTRIENWKKIAISTKTPYMSKRSYPYTGRGPGAFFWTYRVSSGSNFAQAHNEYLEVLYDTGIIGLFLFAMSLFYIFKNTILHERNKYLMSAFIGICVCSGGIFAWHLGMTSFMTILIAGLLNNVTYQPVD